MAETDVKSLCKWNKKLLILVYSTYFIFLGIAGCFVYRTFWPQKTSSPESIIVNVIDAKGKKKELSTDGKAFLNEQLHSALVEVSGKAEAAYNEKFATLLTVLTVFGIAWPIIIVFLQYKLNSNDLEKISEAIIKADTANEQTSSLRKEICYAVADNYYLNAVVWGNEMEKGKDEGNFDKELNGKRCLTRALIKTIYYYALAGKLGQANSKVGITIDRLKEMQNLTDEQKTLAIDELDWSVFLSIGIKRADTIKQLADNVFCKNRPTIE